MSEGGAEEERKMSGGGVEEEWRRSGGGAEPIISLMLKIT